MNAQQIDQVRKVVGYGVLPSLTAIGYYASFGLAVENGLVKHLADLALGKTSEMPMTKRKLIRRWTGIKPIDNYVAFYLAFFVPGVDKDIDQRLQGRHFMTQYVSMWALMMLQTHQTGNSSLLRSSLIFTGFLVQTFGAATAVPIFCALHLLTSSLSKQSAALPFGYDAKDRVSAIPVASLVAIITPLLAATGTKNNFGKHAWFVVWQFYFIFSDLIERTAVPALRMVAPGLALPFNDAVARVFGFAEGLSTVTHLAIVGTILLTNIAPGALGKEYRNLSFVRIFGPRYRLDQEGDMWEARLHFFRADELFSCIAFVFWAATCYVCAAPDGAVRMSSTGEILKFGAKVLTRAAVQGPVGAAAWLLKEREQFLA